MQGFIVFDYAKQYGPALAQIGQWLSEGKLKRQETIIKGGIAASEEAFKQLFQGGNIGKSRGHANIRRRVTANSWTGKLMVEVKNPEEVSRL